MGEMVLFVRFLVNEFIGCFIKQFQVQWSVSKRFEIDGGKLSLGGLLA